jgi:hypothetical protein
MRVFKRHAGAARPRRKKQGAVRSWAETGMRLTFRAELMPGREPLERTFTVASVLANGRVELTGLAGQHDQREFEAARRGREEIYYG